MATATIRYDRSAILRDAWGRARQAAAEAAQGVRLFLSAAMRGAWATAKAALIPSAAPRRFERGAYSTVSVPCGADGEEYVTVTLTDADGVVRTLGAVTLYAEDYDGPEAVLSEALSVIGHEPAPAPESPEVEIARLGARMDELARERDELREALAEARRERIAIVAGEMEGDAGIAWTNEERAEARFDDALERYEEADQKHWYAIDSLGQ